MTLLLLDTAAIATLRTNLLLLEAEIARLGNDIDSDDAHASTCFAEGHIGAANRLWAGVDAMYENLYAKQRTASQARRLLVRAGVTV